MTSGSGERSESSAVVIGNFDGVHRGHRAILELAHERARERGGTRVVALTLWPHPMTVVRPDKAPLLINDIEERVAHLRAAGADEVVVLGFDEETSEWTPEQFVERAISPLQPCAVLVGENFRFGHRAAGDVARLRELAAGRFSVEGVDLTRLDGAAVSSTRVRAALAEGHVEEAAELLGRPYRFTGTVVRGDQRGRELLGYPTANLTVPPGRIVPADGVYAGWLRPTAEPETAWPAAISVGSNPTFDGVERRIESYVLDRDDLHLYDVEVSVDITQRLRGQVKFDSIDDLRTQMTADVDLCRRLLLGASS